MNQHNSDALVALGTRGWTVQIAPGQPTTVPDNIRKRYPWVPDEVWAVLSELSIAASGDNATWFLTGGDYAGTSDSAFAWNEWEALSLEHAEVDDDWKAEIAAFWDCHLPIVLSVRGGIYAHLSLAKTSLKVVAGEAPEFEEVVEVAASFGDLLDLLAQGRVAGSQWK